MDEADTASQNGTEDVKVSVTSHSTKETNSHETTSPDKKTATKIPTCKTKIGQGRLSLKNQQNVQENVLPLKDKIKTEIDDSPCDEEQADSKVKPYTCAVCQKSFAQKSNLVTHFRVHTGSRPYMCMVCGKSFSTSSNAVTHQRVHTGERPYSCGECGKTFSISSNLVTHQRVHTGERPYICSECGKSFTHRSNLVIHRRAHSGEKPYACFTCGKTFTHSSHLVAHQKVHV